MTKLRLTDEEFFTKHLGWDVELTQQEIADKLGISRPCVNADLKAAMRKARKNIEEMIDGT